MPYSWKTHLSLRYSVRTLIFAPAIVVFVLFASYWIPKTAPLPISQDYIGHYRGLGIFDTPGFFGKTYFEITFPLTGDKDDGGCKVDFREAGYNTFRGLYANGSLRCQGTCLVEVDAFGIPYPDIHDIENGTYYRPNGKLGSEVVQGTGYETFWAMNGTKIWEAEIEDHERISLRIWDRTGKLLRSIHE